MIAEISLSLFLAWLIWFIIKTYVKRRGMPPGPFPFPLIGNIPQMMSDSVNPFNKLAEKYGDIFTVSTPVGTAVVLSSASLARNARLGRQEDLSGRLPEAIYPWPEIFGKDVVTCDYSTGYLFRRRVFKSALHVFGTGIKQAEDRLRQAVEISMKEIELKEGEPFNPMKLLESSLFVQLWEWLTSKKLSLDDPSVKCFSEFEEILSKQTLQSTVYHLFPFLRCLPSKFIRDIRRAIQIKEELFPPEFRAHLDTYTPGVVRDITDSFIEAYKKEIAKESGKDIGTIDDISNLMLDVAFGSTVSSRLSWFILYMVLYEDIQEGIHKEIINVVGKDRLPRWEDGQNMPYLQATLCEVLRISASFPYIASNAIRDITIGGYHIPKDTLVFINVDKMHHDEREWHEPQKFKPGRFLESDGSFIGWTKLHAFIPFGLGNRECPGQSLAKITMFTFASILLQRYKIELPEGAESPTTKITPAFISRPQEYQVVARKIFDDYKL